MRNELDTVSMAYGAIVCIGGALGYLRKGSAKSLFSGFVFCMLIWYGARETSRTNFQNVFPSIIAALSLLLIMSYRYWISGKVIPAIPIILLSLAQLIRLCYVIVRRRIIIS